MRAMSTPARQPRWSLRAGPRWLWACALALLLPFAQALAWTHALSHHAPRADSGIPSSLDGPCATCLSAVPLHAAAPPTAPPVPAPPSLRHVDPLAPCDAARAVAATLAYRSRAPPLQG